METKDLVSDIMERYDRQIRVRFKGIKWNQRKLLDASVLIGGVGALGCELAKNLALMGIGTLALVDYDEIELSNLSRQMLFRDEDIGKKKAEVAAKRLEEMNPRINVRYYISRIEDIPEEEFRGISIITSTYDNFQPRHYSNSLAFDLNVPMVDGGTHGFFGHVRIIIPFETPCYECYPPAYDATKFCSMKRVKPEDIHKMLSKYIDVSMDVARNLHSHNYKLLEDILYERDDVLVSLGLTLDQIKTLKKKASPKMPALLTTNAIIGGIMAQEVIKLLHGVKPAYNFISYNGISCGLHVENRPKKLDCWFCGEDGIARE